MTAMCADLTIRDYEPADWPAVCRVHDAARILELKHGGVDPRALRRMEEAAERDEFFVSRTLVGCLGETVVAFVSWNGSCVTWLYVDPAHHRHGIGRRMLAAALQRIGPEAWLESLAGNEPAIALYEQAGMEIVLMVDSKCEGHPCRALRMALPTSRMHDPRAKRDDVESTTTGD